MAAVTASYTHLCPYRKHVIRFDIVSRRIEFCSDPQEFQVTNSGWHGNHNWYPRCRVFTLRDFSYMGTRADFVHNLQFYCHDFSVTHGVWRYTGFPIQIRLTGFAVPANAVAEIIFWDMAIRCDHPAQPLRPPPRPPYTAAEVVRTTVTLPVEKPQRLPLVSEYSEYDSSNAGSTAPSEIVSSEAPSASSSSVATSFTLLSSPTALGSGASGTDSSWQGL